VEVPSQMAEVENFLWASLWLYSNVSGGSPIDLSSSSPVTVVIQSCSTLLTKPRFSRLCKRGQNFYEKESLRFVWG